MSKSGNGTKKTTSFINTESPKYINRSVKGAPMGKLGSADEEKDAAHKLGWGLVNVIETHSAGRPKGDDSRKEVAKALNSESNLRIKSAYGNRTLDERRDARIAEAFVEDKPIEGKSTIARAKIVYDSSKQMGDPLDSTTKALGEMKVYDEDTKRSHKLKNHDKHEN
jgi:hypothetical protein